MSTQSRPITDMDLSTALPKLFHSLPPRKGNLTELADGYKIALEGCTHQGLGVAVLRYIQGRIDGQSTSFAPSPPELARTVRDIDKGIRDLERQTAPKAAEMPPPPREKPTGYVTALNAEFQAWNNGGAPGPLMLAAFAKHSGGERPQHYDGRKFLCEAPNYARAQEMAKTGIVPTGSLYVARFGAFYSPKPEEPHAGRTGQTDSSSPTSAPDVDQGHAGAAIKPQQRVSKRTKASGTIDGDRGSTGASSEAGSNQA